MGDPDVQPEKSFEGRVEREREILAALEANPADDGLRQVYGDWLEENGRAREAELLSLEREIRDAEGRIDESEVGRLGYRLRTLASQLPFSWRALVTRPRIENCRRSGPCPRTWDQLVPTDEPVVRHCETCFADVHLSETMELARMRVARNERVAVDLALARYPRDLEVALARLPLPPVHDGPVTELWFFERDEPPRTLGPLLDSLRIQPPDELSGAGGMGYYRLPDLFADTVQPPEERSEVTNQIGAISVRYHWDMHHSGRHTRFHEIAHRGFDDVFVRFTADGDLIEQWLHTRFGLPREVRGDDPQRPDDIYRVYGKWIYFAYEGGCSLAWHARSLPDWAKVPTDKAVALRFLHELAKLLRGSFVTYEKIKELAERPPPNSGIVVTGPLNKTDFWLGFEPHLSALEVAHALGIAEPIGSSGDIHMSSWEVLEQNQKTRLGYPKYGKWMIRLSLAGWPSGPDVPNRYAAKALTPKDLVINLCIAPFED